MVMETLRHSAIAVTLNTCTAAVGVLVWDSFDSVSYSKPSG